MFKRIDYVLCEVGTTQDTNTEFTHRPFTDVGPLFHDLKKI